MPQQVSGKKQQDIRDRARTQPQDGTCSHTLRKDYTKELLLENEKPEENRTETNRIK